MNHGKRAQPAVRPTSGGSPLGLAVRDLDRDDIAGSHLPSDVQRRAHRARGSHRPGL